MPIEVKDVSYIYDQGTPDESAALHHVNLTFRENEFVAIIGHTGSGKSTLIQHLNGLVKPTSGHILYNGKDIFPQEGKRRTRKEREEHAKRIRAIREKVGLVFQYPEHQLFEMTIARDIAFGPSNLGLSKEEVDQRVNESMEMVGLDPSYRDKSPFELSGGQKRRVAIAGVLAMRPDFLILDEPTAGLDPHGRDEILGQLQVLKSKGNMSIILVSHSMDDVARFAERVIAMDGGEVKFDGTPSEVFKHGEELRRMGLDVPKVTTLAEQLKSRGFDIKETVLDIDQMEKVLVNELKGQREGAC